MNSLLRVVLLFLIVSSGYSQNITLDRIEPPNWWTGMKTNKVQLLIYGDRISKATPTINYEGVKITNITKIDNPNYLFIDITIDKQTVPGEFLIAFTTKSDKITYTYQLKPKTKRSFTTQSVDASDVMYLITPDRFSNADITNDSTADTKEKVNRNNPDGRHGGDLKGVIEHLDYISRLGATTIWLNPVVENNQSEYSYHGYAISDFYKVDSRYGTNEDYRKLVELSHDKKMKVVMDQVFNHCGIGHWWMKDLPSEDWLNQWETFTRSNFTNIAASDPYVSESDYNQFTKGWFDRNMPDLNLENSFLATYMIQNSLWWIEFANLDGIRMDTYPYPNKYAMANWIKAVINEYPNFYIVAETWEKKVSSLSYWNRNTVNSDGYIPYVKSASDYPVYYAMLEAFGEKGDTYKLYETLAEDFVYGNPFQNKIFNGNHDVGRLFTLLGDRKNKVKLSMAFLLTTRGIPQIYYGDEILLEGDKPDGNLRKDFPGGWPSDTKNAFEASGRTEEQQEMYAYISTILNWRKNAEEIHRGKLTHYQPYEGVYVYFRYLNNKRTMIIINNSEVVLKDYSLARYKESFAGFSSGINIINNVSYKTLDTISLSPNTAYIIKLQ